MVWAVWVKTSCIPEFKAQEFVEPTVWPLYSVGVFLLKVRNWCFYRLPEKKLGLYKGCSKPCSIQQDMADLWLLLGAQKPNPGLAQESPLLLWEQHSHISLHQSSEMTQLWDKQMVRVIKSFDTRAMAQAAEQISCPCLLAWCLPNVCPARSPSPPQLPPQCLGSSHRGLVAVIIQKIKELIMPAATWSELFFAEFGRQRITWTMKTTFWSFHLEPSTDFGMCFHPTEHKANRRKVQKADWEFPAVALT